MMHTKKHLRHHVRDTFVAHTGNNHTPHIFSMWGVIGVTFVLMLVAALPRVITHMAGFTAHLAAVLPAALVEETNAVRTGQNLPVVAYSSLLSRAAQAKAEDMILRGYFSHNSPEGLAPWLWLDQVGYNYQYAGENLAIHFNESADVVRAWVASPKHYENLVKPEYTEMGIGVASGVMNGEQTTVVVQFFGAPAPEPQETPAPIVARALELVSTPVEAAPVPATQEVAGASSPHVAQNIERADELELVEKDTQAPSAPSHTPHASTHIEGTPRMSLFTSVLDNLRAYSVALLLVFLLGIASLYVVHHYFYNTHISTVAFGSTALSIIIITLLYNLVTTDTFAIVPTDIQNASTSAVSDTLNI